MSNGITKLKFKRQRKKPIKKDTFKSQDSTSSTITESDENIPKPSSIEQPKIKVNDDNEYLEWGPSINGYRFVGTQNDTNKYYKQRHPLIGSNELDNNGFISSYFELPEFKSNKDLIEEKYNSVDEDYIYDDYYQKWKDIKSSSNNNNIEIIFPIFNQSNELTKLNIESFLKSSTGDYNQVLKIERLRWHPDKFIKFINNDKNLIEKITTTFQIINDLYEKRN